MPGARVQSAAVPKTDRAADLGGELIYMNEPTYLAKPRGRPRHGDLRTPAAREFVENGRP